MSVRIQLVPSNHLGWVALRAIIQNEPGTHLVGEEGRADAAVLLAGRARPNAVLMDAEPKEYPVPVLARRLQRQCPEARLLVFGSEPNRRLELALREIGVEGFLLWDDLTPEALHYALGAVLLGGLRVESRAVTEELRVGPERRPYPRGAGDAFVEREREVLGGLAEGLSEREIAERIGVGLRTVERMARRLEDKCCVYSLRELRRKARELGFAL